MQQYHIIHILLLSFVIHCDSKRYTNYTLFRATPISQPQLTFLSQLGKFYEVNFWKEPGSVYNPVEFVISPNDKPQFLKDVQKYGLYLATIMENVQSAFDEQVSKYQPFVRRRMETFDWQKFYRLKDIYDWLTDLQQMNSKEMQIMDIGTTHENRPIKAVKIRLKGARPRSKVIIEGGIHAREWISPAVVTYLIDKLIHAKDSKDEELKSVALSYEWYIVPVLNPDGYEYSHMKDRLWRKNRQPYGKSLKDYGVDLNRNFGIAFGTVGVSTEEGIDIFCGPRAFSEVESWAWAEFVRNISQNVEYYLAFHSYGQYMIYPYAYSKKEMENYNEVKMMAKEMSNEIAKKRGTHYTIGTAYSTVGYTTSGVSMCWVKKAFKVPYVLTLELPPTDDSIGFAIHPSEIIPVCTETLAGLKKFLKPRTPEFHKLIRYEEESDEDAQGRPTFNTFLLLLCNFMFFNAIF